MNQKNCNLCGMLILQNTEYCETCAQMMGVEAPQTAPATESHITQINGFAPPLSPPTVPSPTPPVVTPQPPTQTAVIGYSSNYQSGYSKPPNNDSFRPKPSTSSAESTYKPGLLDWFWDLPGIFKIGIAVIIASLLFAFALKIFMQMDVSVTATAPPPNLEQQKPWFSGWFRSNPTKEEIFEKYEKETFTKGNKIFAETYQLSGTIYWLRSLSTDATDFSTLYKNKGTSPSTNTTNTLSQAEGKFELFLKSPNYLLFKGVADPIPDNEKTLVPFITGFDGTKQWDIIKSSRIIQNSFLQSGISPTPIFYVTPVGGGISLTFHPSNYQKTELAGEDYPFNRRSYVIKGTDFTGKETSLGFDVETGLLTKIIQPGLTMYVLEHKSFEGILYPAKIVYRLNNKWTLLEIETIQSDVPMSNTIFFSSSN